MLKRMRDIDEGNYRGVEWKTPVRDQKLVQTLATPPGFQRNHIPKGKLARLM